MNNNKKIGLFDSGSGGLSILQKLIGSKYETIVYIADTAYLPYGQQTKNVLLERAILVTHLLLQHNIDTIIVACHTSSATVLSELKLLFPEINYIDMLQPTIDAALIATKNNNIGVFATPATIASGIHKTKILMKNKKVKVIEQACPALVPLIEAGNTQKELVKFLNSYLQPMMKSHVDTLILGCTHYAFVAPQIKKINSTIKLITAADCIIHEKNRINQTITFFISGSVKDFNQKINSFLLPSDHTTIQYKKFK